MRNPETRSGYSMGHPWHYVLGGDVPGLKQIRALAIERGYRGYMEADILSASQRSEPWRSNRLREIRATVIEDLQSDISRYRQLARELHQYRRQHPQDPDNYQCTDIHTGMSLKFAHLYNGFAHLHTLDALPEQHDLFDLL